MQSKTLAIGNLNIRILDAEVSPPATKPQPLPVVFVHGMACSADLWTTQLKHTAHTRRAIAIDLRGHGSSTPPEDGDYSPASCADDLFSILDSLELNQIVLVGHSYGSCVALATAASQPQRITQLVLIDPPIDCTQCPPDVYEEQIAPMQATLTGDNWRAGLEASFRQALSGSSSTTSDYILARLANTPKDRLLGTSRELFTFRAVEMLDRYLVATESRVHAILAPTNNAPFSLHVLRPTIIPITLPNTGHWLMLDAPEAFSAALDHCLTSK